MKSKNNKNILKTLGFVLVVVVFCLLVLYLTNSNMLEGMNGTPDPSGIKQRLENLLPGKSAESPVAESAVAESAVAESPVIKKNTNKDKQPFSAFTKESFIGSIFE